jgi:AcrR family transcriptional regulator
MGNREDLLAGAKRCLLEKGYERTTVRDIATEAGVSMAAIGYHFGSREALLTAAMVDSLSEWGDEVSDALTPQEGANPAQWFVEIWPKLIESLNGNRHMWAASIEAFVVSEHSDELRKLLTYGQRLARRGLASRVAGVAEDQVDDRTARTLGSAQLALFVGITMQWLQDPEWAPTAEELIEGIRGIAALLPPPAS